MKQFILFILCFSLAVFADTPPPNTVRAKLFSGDGLTEIKSTASGSIQVNISNTTPIPVSGTFSVTVDPAGLATSAKQDVQTTALQSIDSKLTAPLSVSGTLSTVPSGVQSVSGSVSVLNFPATQAVTGTFYQSIQPISGSVSVSNFPSVQDVDTGLLQSLTDTQLRASPVDVDTGLTQGLTDAQLRATAVNTYLTNGVNVSNTVSVTGPLTDTQLRASVIPVSVPSGVSITNTVPVSGPLTDVQLRASSVPVDTGLIQALTNSQLRASAISVDTSLAQPLTNAQLRATPIEVSATVTAVVDTAGLATSSWQSSQTTVLNSINSKLGGTLVVSGTNAATASNQSTQTTYLNQIESHTNDLTLGIGGVGSGLNTYFYQVAGSDGTNARALKTNSAGEQIIVVSGTPNVTFSGIVTTSATGTTPVSIASTVPVSSTGTASVNFTNTSITANAGTNLNTSSLNLESTQSAMSAKLPSSLGIKTAANSLSIAPASDGIFNVSGTVSANPSGTYTVQFASTPSVSVGTVAVTGSVTANAGTNLNTSALALESGGNLATIKTNTDPLIYAQGSTTSGQVGNLGLTATTVAAPTYVTAKTNPLSTDTLGNLRVIATPSGTTTVTGTVTANISGSISNTSFTATQATGTNLHTVVDSGAVTVTNATATNLKAQAEAYQGGSAVGTANPLWTQVSGTLVTSATGTTAVSAAALPLPALASTSTKQSDGSQKTQIVDGSGNVIAATSNALNVNISGGSIANTSFTATQGTATSLKTQAENYQGGTAVGTANPLWVQTSGTQNVTFSNTSITANAGTNLNTSLLALESGGNLATIKTNTDPLVYTQGSTTSGQVGNLGLTATTTGAPTYVTAKTNPLSTDTLGNLRVVATPSGTTTVSVSNVPHVIADSGSTTAVTGNVTVAQATGTNLHAVIDTGSTTAVTGNVTVVQSTNSSLKADVTSNSANIATESSLAKLTLTQGSTTSGQSGTLVQGAVTTGAPSYTTAQTSPLSLDTAGNLRVVNTTSGSVTVAQGTATNLKAQAEVYQGGTAVGTANPLWIQASGTGMVVSQPTATNLKTQAEQYQGGTAIGTANPMWMQVSGTVIGAVNETAPASDTASSGLNGRLQRIAQNLTTMNTTPLVAGTAIIGKAGIDQTTPGTTNGVSIAQLGANTVSTSVGPTGTGTLRVNQANIAAATLANVASSATSVTLQASNASRVGLNIFNDSTAVLYVKFGATASLTSYTLQIAPGGYYEMPLPIYSGIIDGIWAAANGNARMTEF